MTSVDRRPCPETARGHRRELETLISRRGLSNRRAEAGGLLRLGVRTDAPKSGNDLHSMLDIAG